MTRPLIIDTDPGTDDALAIMLAAASPEVRIIGISAVAGNTDVGRTAANAAALADLLDLDCPVGRGASGPLWRRDNRRRHRLPRRGRSRWLRAATVVPHA